MNSTLLNQMGLGWLDPGYLFIATAVLLILILIIIILLGIQISKAGKLKKRLDKFLTGKDGMSLEQDIAGLCEDNKLLKNMADKKDRKSVV